MPAIDVPAGTTLAHGAPRIQRGAWGQWALRAVRLWRLRGPRSTVKEPHVGQFVDARDLSATLAQARAQRPARASEQRRPKKKLQKLVGTH